MRLHSRPMPHAHVVHASDPAKLPPRRGRVNAQGWSRAGLMRVDRSRGHTRSGRKTEDPRPCGRGSPSSWALVSGRVVEHGGHVRRGFQSPQGCSPYQPCACPSDSFARDRGISRQTAKHEEDRELSFGLLPSAAARPPQRLGSPTGHRKVDAREPSGRAERCMSLSLRRVLPNARRHVGRGSRPFHADCNCRRCVLRGIAPEHRGNAPASRADSGLVAGHRATLGKHPRRGILAGAARIGRGGQQRTARVEATARGG